LKLKNFLSKIGKSSKKVIYLTKDVEIENREEKRDIVLSPNLYWIKKEKISLSSEREALKFAPSIFEGLIENLEDFRFLAIKGSEEYIFIAYNPLEISQKLKNDFGISENAIGNIYTAQTEFGDIEEALSINRFKMLVSIDGIISEIPKHSRDSSTNYAGEYLKKRNRTKYSLKYKTGSGASLLYIASIIPLFLSISFVADIVKIDQALVDIQSEIERRREVYQLPSTSFQIESIRNRYLEIEQQQKFIRSYLYWLQNENLERDGKVVALSIDRDNLNFKFDIKKGSSINRIKGAMQKKNKSVQLVDSGNILDVGFKR
jgi:hypothetical protein